MADCQFDPKAITIWADRKNVRLLSDAQREDAYLRAAPFLLEQMKTLIEKGWTRESNKPDDDEILFDLTYYGEDKLTLPSTFNAFLDESKEDTWHTIFTNSWVFFATCKEEDEKDLFIDSSGPLSNIFYLLQALAPGMLVIFRDINDDVDKQGFSRALPRKSWIEEHRHLLEEIMGNTETVKALMAAAEDYNIAYNQEDALGQQQSIVYDQDDSRADEEWDDRNNRFFWDGHYSDGSDSENYIDMWGQRQTYDYTACSSHGCGFCGRCDY